MAGTISAKKEQMATVIARLIRQSFFGYNAQLLKLIENL